MSCLVLGEVLLFFIFAFVLFCWEFGVKHKFILRNTNLEIPAHVEIDAKVVFGNIC